MDGMLYEESFHTWHAKYTIDWKPKFICQELNEAELGHK